jgi:flagellar basal-body rod protein FlgB
MGDPLFDSSTLPLLQKVAAFTERRQSILAGNIANASTPNYQARDLPVAEFQEALRDAIAQRQSPPKGGENAAWSFQKAAGAKSLGELLPAELMQAVPLNKQLNFQDGNNRSIERNVMEMTKNSLMQTMAIELITAQMNRLQAAISERP